MSPARATLAAPVYRERRFFAFAMRAHDDDRHEGVSNSAQRAASQSER